MLQQFREKHQTKLFKKYRAFFAFSKEQYHEQVDLNFGKITSLDGGLFCPSIFVNNLIFRLEQINKDSITKVIENNSKKDIIWDALANYETQITGDCTDAIDSLADYPGISKKDIYNEYRAYYNHCIENDLF